MKEYKDTLNLPKTDFPMKANLPHREPETLQRWNRLNLYKKLRDLGQNRPRFILHDGPPYANARPHMGTAMNKVLKDMIVKSKTLSGFDAPYVPGWDCHGLPIELNVEKKKGKAGTKLSVNEFRAACREYAKTQVAIQMEDFQRMGVVADWPSPYLTMHFEYEANVVRSLSKMIENGHLHRGQKPVHWCTACASALAEAEVEYRDKTSPAIDVAFAVVDSADFAARLNTTLDASITNIALPIWTTTPWTLPANQAVSLNANLDYVLVQCDLQGESRYVVLAKALHESALERYGVKSFDIVAEFKGEVLEGLMLTHPLPAFNRKVPVVLGDHVTIDAGTGNVHTAPAHGQDDYVVGQRYQLPMDNPVNARSCFVDGTPLVEGLHVFKANEPITDALTSAGTLLASEALQHSYPHCWRHKTPLIFRATPQWFISMDQQGLRQMAIEAIKKTEWQPAWGETRLHNMVADRPDWCISRQRTWGSPITLFVHHSTGELHPETPRLMEAVAKRIEKAGLEAWYNLDPKELLGDEAEDWVKITDILDVWLDAGVSHASVLAKRPELGLPADLYLEGSDQHRGWFQSSLLTSLAMHGEAPFKTVLTHGYVVDAKGLKMSKSIGNVVAPADVINKMGADVMRLWVASSDYRNDVNYSEEIMKRCADAYRRIRNTARFLLSNLSDFEPKKHVLASDELLMLDRWAIDRTRRMQEAVVKNYDEYHFQKNYQLLHNFCAVDMGSFYLDIIKDRLYTCKRDGLPRRSAQTAMYHILQALVHWLAPITSFTAEEIWQHMPGKKEDSVFLSTWYKALAVLPDTEAMSADYWLQIQAVRDEVNKLIEQLRKDGVIGSALEAKVTIFADEHLYQHLSLLKDELRFVLITSEATVKPMAEAEGRGHECEIAGTHATHVDAQAEHQADAKSAGGSMLRILVEKTDADKCQRCWQRSHDVGRVQDHPELCARCVENISGAGEVRSFA